MLVVLDSFRFVVMLLSCLRHLVDIHVKLIVQAAAQISAAALIAKKNY